MITVNKNGKDFSPTYAEHMLHHKNLESVLLNGLLSHNAAHSKQLIKEDISMPEVQRRRLKVPYVNGFPYFKPSIHDLVSFYFNSKNPMLYKRKEMQAELVIILISADILDSKKTDGKFAIFSDGNAGSSATKFFIGKDKLTNVDLELIFSGSWNNEDPEIKKENVRKMCAEILVYPAVTVKDIQKIVCPNQTMYDYVTSLKAKLGISVAHIAVEIQTGYFFFDSSKFVLGEENNFNDKFIIDWWHSLNEEKKSYLNNILQSEINHINFKYWSNLTFQWKLEIILNYYINTLNEKFVNVPTNDGITSQEIFDYEYDREKIKKNRYKRNIR